MPTTEEDEDRREFLKTCGRFAAVTPPAMTLLLSTSLTSTAIARSGAQDGAGYSGGSGSSHSVFDNDPHSATEDHSTKEHSSAGGGGGGSGGGGGENSGGAKGSKVAHSGEEGSRSGGGGGNKGSSGFGGQDGDDKKKKNERD
jgi:hypothetical protein